MINKFDLAKALNNQAKIVTDANSWVLVANGQDFTPDVNNIHVREFVLYGDDNGGLANDSSDIQIGIYQLSVYTPKTLTKWRGLQVIDILQASFSKGLKLIFNNQMVVIINSSLEHMDINDNHIIHHLSIRFSVIN